MSKKAITIILSLMIAAVLISGCGKKEEPVTSESVEMQEPEEPEIPEPEPVVEPEPEPEPIAEPEPEPVQEEVEPDLGYEIISIDEVQMYVTTNANIRSGPSTDYDIVGGLTYAQEITVNGKVETADSTWYVIKTDDNTTQMVSASLVSQTKPVQKSTSNTNGNGSSSQSQQPSSGGGSTSTDPEDASNYNVGDTLPWGGTFMGDGSNLGTGGNEGWVIY